MTDLTQGNANPYAPPISDITVGNDAEFYVVANDKFLVMFFGTAGIYIIYWLYRNWRAYAEASGESISPALRAVFAIFFIHSLFNRIREKLDAKSIVFKWRNNMGATLLVVLFLLGMVIDRIAILIVPLPAAQLASPLLILPEAFFWLKAQDAINHACRDVRGDRNADYSTANYVWLAVGLVIWGLTFYGAFLPD
ncbi:MAG: hypothetical protein ING75_04970 [Rhodocyclaceae bacterium]|nr:hypothetical protein [Rhodocyclaceae bacterium]